MKDLITGPAVLLGMLVLSVLPTHGALAQGFSSLSSGAPSTPNPCGRGCVDRRCLGCRLASAGPVTRKTTSFELADRILVRKGERRLFLLRQERVIAEYPVRLGLNPHGPKMREGDFRTPEGKYRLVRRNPQSEFFLSIQVSYPSAEDAAVAKEHGVEPGGAIMIHGQPNIPRKPADFYASKDWTDGCIALSNSDMVDFWLRTGVGIPIEIKP